MSTKLFEIQTPDLELTWHSPVEPIPVSSGDSGTNLGLLRILPAHEQVHFMHISRGEKIPDAAANDPSFEIGPRLFEQVNYRVLVSSVSGKKVRLANADPGLCKGLATERGGTLQFGPVNFRSNVGFSKFTVFVDDRPEFDFVVHVFPTKLDYEQDYKQLLSETQSYVAGLIYEFLRSTYRLSIPAFKEKSTDIEWLVLLRAVILDLERAASFIAMQPRRAVTRKIGRRRIERIRRVDSTVRKAIARGKGSGSLQSIEELPLKEKIPTQKATSTLDTPEHRWIANQLRNIRQKLATLLERVTANNSGAQHAESDDPDATRNSILRDSLRELEHRISRIESLEVFRATAGGAPPGYASVQLISAPGYREIYRSCSVLSLGLRLDEGLTGISLKELSTLYEYWCFLTVVATVARLTNSAIPVSDLVKQRNGGVQIDLKKGQESAVNFVQNDRKITVTFNKSFPGLVVQKPDILLTVKTRDWPKLQLLLDAKYRVRFDGDTLRAFGSPGPDIDSINVLHRYRDAILEEDADENEGTKPRRTIIQAAALFPLTDGEQPFDESNLWRNLTKLGVGAIPLLPTNKHWFETWLGSMLATGEWQIAEKALGHTAVQRAADLRNAASEVVLIAVLRPANAKQHLDWIFQNRTYYMPLLKTQPRQLATRYIALYQPSTLYPGGAITHVATVLNRTIKERGEIATPWCATARTGSQQVVFETDEFAPLKRPIKNRTSTQSGERFSTVRWSTSLALQRASTLSEMFLESEQEWQLYEACNANAINFSLAAGPAKDPQVANWRTWFTISDQIRFRYDGPNGFLLDVSGNHSIISSERELFSRVTNELDLY